MLEKRAAGALLILLLPLAGCGRGSDSEEAVSEQSAGTPVEAVFRYGPVKLGVTRAELRRQLGEPDSVRATAVANRHDPSVIDSLVTLHYPGLSAGIYRAMFDGRELLAELVITDDRHLRAESPLRMGMSPDEVQLLLGAPSGGNADTLRYVCASCNAAGNDVLELQLPGGGLRRIVLRFWLD